MRLLYIHIPGEHAIVIEAEKALFCIIPWPVPGWNGKYVPLQHFQEIAHHMNYILNDIPAFITSRLKVELLLHRRFGNII